MARPLNQVRWDYWRELMARQRDSGLSVTEFCRRENVSRQGFHAWKRKLHSDTGETASAPRSENRQALPASRRQPRHGRTKPALPTAAPGFLQLPVTTMRPNPWIELALSDGTVVRLPQQNLEALVVVLRALRGERLEVSEGAGGHA